MYKPKPLTDPIGPGSLAWQYADTAAHHFGEGNKNAAYCAQRRMLIELRKHGATNEVINDWKQDIRDYPVE